MYKSERCTPSGLQSFIDADIPLEALHPELDMYPGESFKTWPYVITLCWLTALPAVCAATAIHAARAMATLVNSSIKPPAYSAG